MTTAANLIAAALAAPKTHQCVTLYADGSVRIHETRSERTAQMHAIGERAKIGRALLRMGTNQPAPMVTDVYVSAI